MHSYISVLLGVFLIGLPIWRFVILPKATKSWPEADAWVSTEKPIARLGVLPPSETLFGPSIKTVVRYRIENRILVTHHGFEMKTKSGSWSRILVPNNFKIRYHPNDPQKVFLHHAILPEYKSAITAFCFFLGALILLIGIATWGS